MPSPVCAYSSPHTRPMISGLVTMLRSSDRWLIFLPCPPCRLRVRVITDSMLNRITVTVRYSEASAMPSLP